MRAALATLALCSGASALRNGLNLVPPLGWSNWEAYGCNITDKMIRQNAEAVKSKGLLDAGYTIIGIDDCWADADRNASGHLVPSKDFPDMKGLGDYLHGEGFQYGIYSSAGGHCCQHTMPGSLGYEYIDAMDFASWGVDYLKYDGCFMEEFPKVLEDSPRRYPFSPPPILRYPQMALALNKTGRPISYLCNFPWQFWGLDKDPAMGGDWVGEFCNSWRTGGDARPGYDVALRFVDQAEHYSADVPSGPGRWNHLDSLEIGNNGSFANSDKGGMTESQEQVIFSLFVVAKSPLFIGASAVDLEGHSLRTLLNKDVIAVHQDPLGARGHKVASFTSACGVELWTVKTTEGAAALLVNRGNTDCHVTDIELDAQLGLDSRNVYTVRDLWKHRAAVEPNTKAGVTKYGCFDVLPTSCIMLRFEPRCVEV